MKPRAKYVFSEEEIEYAWNNIEEKKSIQIFENIKLRVITNQECSSSEKQYYVKCISILSRRDNNALIELRALESNEDFENYLFREYYLDFINRENVIQFNALHEEFKIRKYSDNIYRGQLFYLLRRTVKWKQLFELNRSRLSGDFVFDSVCIEVREREKFINKKSNQFKNWDGTIRTTRLYHRSNTLLMMSGKFSCILVNEIIGAKKYYCESLNTFKFCIDARSMAHIFIRHFGKVAQGYISDKTFFDSWINNRNFFKEVNSLLNKAKGINWSYLTSLPQDKKGIFFEKNSQLFVMYFEVRKSESTLNYLSSFFPVEKEDERKKTEVLIKTEVETGIFFYHK